MKKNYLIILSSLIFLLIGCKEKATPEMIEKYEQLMKQKELYTSKYSISDFYTYTYSTMWPYYDNASIYKKYYSPKFLDEVFRDARWENYLTFVFEDENHFDITLNIHDFMNSEDYYNVRMRNYLKNALSDHNNYHKDLIPGTKEWEIWMINSITSKDEEIYSNIIDKKGKYKPDKWIKGFVQTCPFCCYKDEVFRETGEIKETENWFDLYLFNTPEKYWQWEKDFYLNYHDFKHDENFIAQQKQFLKTVEKNTKEDYNTLKLYSAKTISEEIRDNRLIAKDKYKGKQLKIRGQIESVDEEYVELLYGPYVFLPKEELKKLHRGQYITFVATIKFIDYSSGNTNASGFEKGARDLDDAFSDLDKVIEDANSGGSGYSFVNPKLLQVEEGKLYDSSDWEDISIFDFF